LPIKIGSACISYRQKTFELDSDLENTFSVLRVITQAMNYSCEKGAVLDCPSLQLGL
jgi:hypothetical protein